MNLFCPVLRIKSKYLERLKYKEPHSHICKTNSYRGGITRMSFKKWIALIIGAMMVLGCLAACSKAPRTSGYPE